MGSTRSEVLFPLVMSLFVACALLGLYDLHLLLAIAR
jgi:hypothetical protein